MNKPVVSVVVPVYNVEKYLRRCLDSLVSQTLKEIEIVVVNDGATDNSQDIIDQYKNKYPNIKSFIKENGGLGDARNFGLQNAQGNYIGFIDSDDWVEPSMFEKMYMKAIAEDSDLVVCDLIYDFEDDNAKNYIVTGLRGINSNPKKDGFLSPLFAWNKLYKRELLLDNHLQYPVKLWYEDIPVTLPCFALAKNISYVNKAFVHYTQRATSIMSSKNSKKYYDIFSILDLVYSFFEKHSLLDEYQKELEYVFAEQLMVYGAFRFLRSDDYYNLSETARSFINNKYPSWKNNVYLNKLFNLKNRLFYKTNGPLTYNFWKRIIK